MGAHRHRPRAGDTFDDVVVLARLYRTALDHLGVVGVPKVTGQRGIQIWVPIDAGYTFEETRAWVERLSRASGRTVPELVSWQWHKGERAGRARLDYTQNAINKTLVAPFSARPAAGAPVSVPDQVGRARRPGPPARPLDDPHRRRTAGGAAATPSVPCWRTHSACRASRGSE